jgi:hypothetical protein
VSSANRNNHYVTRPGVVRFVYFMPFGYSSTLQPYRCNGPAGAAHATWSAHILTSLAGPRQTGHSAKSISNSEPKIEIFQACLGLGGMPTTDGAVFIVHTADKLYRLRYRKGYGGDPACE